VHMRRWSEGKAAGVAVVASATALLATYGVTLIMRNATFAMRMPEFLTSVQGRKSAALNQCGVLAGSSSFPA
jgi:hypothetical protein